MAKIAILFGAILVAMGGYSYVTTGHHPTALIPAWFGLVLILCGAMAAGDDAKKRMLWMHIAVTVGLIGFVFPGTMATISLVKSHTSGVPLARPEAVHAQAHMALVCLIFVALCVRSFIAARRARVV
jgi:hypothetical protein